MQINDFGSEGNGLKSGISTWQLTPTVLHTNFDRNDDIVSISRATTNESSCRSQTVTQNIKVYRKARFLKINSIWICTTSIEWKFSDLVRSGFRSSKSLTKLSKPHKFFQFGSLQWTISFPFSKDSINNCGQLIISNFFTLNSFSLHAIISGTTRPLSCLIWKPLR